VPADHVVSATGELQNASIVLSAEQRKRLQEAKTAKQPVFIITPDEALKNEESRSKSTKKWTFKAKNVRDFAFASSRKFIWDAMGVKQEKSDVMAMSFYPKEGNPLWEKYSTKVVAHTLRVYSRHTFDYPYPVAISVHAKWIGMEYPMICFNGGRPEADGTYSAGTKYGMLGVIIHEVGHNYFPMIVNSDERQWSWMDEGLNTFLQYLTEQEWERDYPSRRGPAHLIVDYMKGDRTKISPIMTNSESLWQFGNNAYGKPATALNILRETIMGRELFDYAFKTYAQRWMFKHPTPADFFRTMEDASAVDLDWFWRGWFFTTEHVDIALNKVTCYRLNNLDLEKDAALNKEKKSQERENISTIRNRQSIKQTQTEIEPDLKDFYNTRDPYEILPVDLQEAQELLKSLTPSQKALLEKDLYFYEIHFENIGGLVMPLIVEFTFADGSTEVHYIPAEIWRKDSKNVSKVFITDKLATQIVLDPFLETADTDISNNYWQSVAPPTRYEIFKKKASDKNDMQRK
jgi:hypothetical protein